MTKIKEMPKPMSFMKDGENRIYVSKHADGYRINFEMGIMAATYLLDSHEIKRMLDYITEVHDFITQDDKLETRKKEILDKQARV